jgi:membrane fusion protein (multidrug efflux system)
VLAFFFRLLIAGVLIAGSAAAGAYFLGYLGEAESQARRQEQTPPVIAGEVKRRALVDRIEAIGTTFANESVTLTAPVTELIQSVNFEDGEKVKRGDVLIELSTAVQKASLESARATLEEADKQLVRIRKLAAQGNTAETKLDEQIRIRDTAKAEVERMQAEIERRIIRAPFDGVMGLKRISPGALVQPSTELAVLQDISVLKLDFTVPEIYFTSLRPKQEIVARSPVYPDKEFKGEISAIEPRVDPVSRAVTVRALLPNPESLLKSGMLMSVSIIRERAHPLMVAEQSVISIGEKSYVFKLEPGDIVRRVEIETGRREPGFVEVKSGLSEGEVIVIEGTIRIKDGMKVRPQRRGGAAPRRGSADADFLREIPERREQQET